jgi:hypothetical protein
MLVHGPIGQPANYHAFADHTDFLTIPYASDVLSNLGFALVGFGESSVSGRKVSIPPSCPGESVMPYF